VKEKSLDGKVAVITGGSSGIGLATLQRHKPALRGLPSGGMLGPPADILVSPSGTVKAIRYGKHALDQWSVGEVVANPRSMNCFKSKLVNSDPTTQGDQVSNEQRRGRYGIFTRNRCRD
jgi:hypothetical protein